VLRAYRDREPRASSYLDAMAASGIRGVRAAAEGYDTTCADVDPDAVELAAENLAANDLDGETVHRDVNALLCTRTSSTSSIWTRTGRRSPSLTPRSRTRATSSASPRPTPRRCVART